MNQARSEEEEKERKRDRKDRGQEADGKKGSPTKQNTSEELKQGLPTYRHRVRLTEIIYNLHILLQAHLQLIG